MAEAMSHVLQIPTFGDGRAMALPTYTWIWFVNNP